MLLRFFDDGLVVVIGNKEVDEILFRHNILLRKGNSADFLFINPACDNTGAIACKRGNFLGKQGLFIVRKLVGVILPCCRLVKLRRHKVEAIIMVHAECALHVLYLFSVILLWVLLLIVGCCDCFG